MAVTARTRRGRRSGPICSTQRLHRPARVSGSTFAEVPASPALSPLPRRRSAAIGDLYPHGGRTRRAGAAGSSTAEVAAGVVVDIWYFRATMSAAATAIASTTTMTESQGAWTYRPVRDCDAHDSSDLRACSRPERRPRGGGAHRPERTILRAGCGLRANPGRASGAAGPRPAAPPSSRSAPPRERDGLRASEA